MRHGSGVEFVRCASDRFTETAAIEFTWLPVTRKESLLHLNVAIDNRTGEGGVNDLRQFISELLLRKCHIKRSAYAVRGSSQFCCRGSTRRKH